MKVDNISFKGIHYSKIPLHANEIKDMHSLHEYPSLIEHNIPQEVKEIMEHAPIFRDLNAAGTDIFVTLGYSKADLLNKKSNKILGALMSSFINPYNNTPESLSIFATGLSKQTILEKIKNTAMKLPYYNELKKNLFGNPSITKSLEEWMINAR